MIKRSDIVLLGFASGMSGGLTGGLVLGIGLAMLSVGVNLGWLLLFVGAPMSAIVGWIMGRRLAKRLPADV